MASDSSSQTSATATEEAPRMRAASSLACRQVVALARYHKWAHALLWETVSALPEEALIRDLRLPFQSLAATYNHMLAGDCLWYSRFTGQSTVAGLTSTELSPYWAGTPSGGGWAALPGALTVTEVASRLALLCDDWIRYVEGLSEDQLDAALVYHNTSGAEQRKNTGLALAHVFNHGTHHRGQVTVGLTLLGGTVPPLDLSYFLDQEASEVVGSR